MRIVHRGDSYGRAWCLTHDQDEPLVEFYTPSPVEADSFGYFLSRYNATTIMNAHGGILIANQIKQYILSERQLLNVQQILRAKIHPLLLAD